MSAIKSIFTKPLRVEKVTSRLDLDLVVLCRLPSTSLPSVQHHVQVLFKTDGLRTSVTNLHETGADSRISLIPNSPAADSGEERAVSWMREKQPQIVPYGAQALIRMHYPETAEGEATVNSRALLLHGKDGRISFYLHGALRFSSPEHMFLNRHDAAQQGLDQIFDTLAGGGCKLELAPGCRFAVHVGLKGKLGKKKFKLLQLQAIAASFAIFESALDAVKGVDGEGAGPQLKSVLSGRLMAECKDAAAVFDEIYYCTSVRELKSLINPDTEGTAEYKLEIADDEVVFRQFRATRDTEAAVQWIKLVTKFAIWAAEKPRKGLEQNLVGAPYYFHPKAGFLGLLRLMADDELAQYWKPHAG